MRAPIALEKKSVLWDEIIAYLEAQNSTDLRNDLRWKSLWRSCEGLAKNDAAASSLFRAVLAGCAGDMTTAEYWLKNLEQLGDAARARAWRICLLCNLGYASGAIKLSSEALENPGPLTFADIARPACLAGAFTSVARAVDNASKQNKVLVGAADLIEIARNGDLVLSKIGMTEDQYGAILDVAGEMMRARQLAWSEKSSYHVIDEGPEQLGLLMTYRIDVTPEDASEMNFELACTLVDRDLDKPGLSVSFQGIKAH